MGEMLIAYDNVVGRNSGLSGGSYVPEMPLGNLSDRQLGVVARTVDLDPGSTWFDWYVTSPTPTRVLALANHNISLDARYDLRISTELATRNYAPHTESLSSGTWLGAGISIVSNGRLAPDGEMTMDKAVGAATLDARFGKETSQYASGGRFGFSVFIAAGGWSEIIADAGPSDDGSPISSILVRINFATGAASLLSSGSFTEVSIDCEEAPNDCLRVKIEGVAPSDVGTMRFTLSPNDTGEVDGVNGVWAWGWQFEDDEVTSYFPNGAAAYSSRPAGYMDLWQTYDYAYEDLVVWPSVYTSESLDWEASNFWAGVYLDTEIEGTPWTLVHILPEKVYLTGIQFRFRDPNNADGYIQYGRLFVASSWQPVYNANYGATLGWQTDTEVQASLSGAKFFDRRAPLRVVQAKFDVMTETEGLTGIFEIMRRSGIDKEVLFVWDPDDTLHAIRRQFLGHFRTLSPLEFPEGFINGNHRSSVGIEIEELGV